MAQTTQNTSFGPVLVVVVSHKSIPIAVMPIVVVDIN